MTARLLGGRSLVRRVTATIAVVLVAGFLAGGLVARALVPAVAGEHRGHGPTEAGPDPRPPIFGDLFEDHGGHTP